MQASSSSVVVWRPREPPSNLSCRVRRSDHDRQRRGPPALRPTAAVEGRAARRNRRRAAQARRVLFRTPHHAATRFGGHRAGHRGADGHAGRRRRRPVRRTRHRDWADAQAHPVAARPRGRARAADPRREPGAASACRLGEAGRHHRRGLHRLRGRGQPAQARRRGDHRRTAARTARLGARPADRRTSGPGCTAPRASTCAAASASQA